MNFDEIFIKRALQLAKNGVGTTRPNPSVGAVVVYENIIIGEGFTSPYGGPHAEVNAIHAVKDKTLLKKATIYVTLEPCAHFGKTPPCANFIVENQLKRVVVGCLDTNPLVAGKGIAILENAGLTVVTGILEQACKSHHQRFFTYQNFKRPFILLKWAVSADGYLAPSSKNEQKPVWISNAYSQQLVHKLRAQEHAILVGANTVLEDNPELTVRSWSGNQPIRVVLDNKGNLSTNFTVFNDKQKTIIITPKGKDTSKSKHLFWEEIDYSKQVTSQICAILYKHGIQSLLVEGGAKTLQLFIDENCWDKALVFSGNVQLQEGLKAPVLQKKPFETRTILGDTLTIYKND